MKESPRKIAHSLGLPPGFWAEPDGPGFVVGVEDNRDPVETERHARLAMTRLQSQGYVAILEPDSMHVHCVLSDAASA